jgi:hypothetical protein
VTELIQAVALRQEAATHTQRRISKTRNIGSRRPGYGDVRFVYHTPHPR